VRCLTFQASDRARRRSVLHTAMRWRVRVGVAAAMTFFGGAVAPGVAGAARVLTFGETDDDRLVVYEAAPGETNRLVVQDVEGDPPQVRLLELVAPLTVLPDCAASPDEGARALCPRGLLTVDLGDRADVALVAASRLVGAVLRGGDGDDELVADSVQAIVAGEGGNDRIRLGLRVPGKADGGPGRDVIRAGPEADEAIGGPGDDLIVSNRPFSPNLVLGEEGNDVLRLRNVPPSFMEQPYADGGQGDDLLFVAPGAPIVVEPEPGTTPYAWQLFGRDGRDVLIGGPNPDLLWGGPGDDVLISRDGQADSVQCEDGFDIAFADPEDFLAECETQLRLPRARVAGLRATLERMSHAVSAEPTALRTRVQQRVHQALRGGLPLSRRARR
jgi:RTX calcium-binding nonapeptide repeat (4 copies)